MGVPGNPQEIHMGPKEILEKSILGLEDLCWGQENPGEIFKKSLNHLEESPMGNLRES